MIKPRQQIDEKQTEEHRLSLQQIQDSKLLQLRTIALEERIKEELEENPLLEEGEPDELESELDMNEWEEGNVAEEELQPVDQNEEVDWDEFMENSQHDGEYYGGSSGY